MKTLRFEGYSDDTFGEYGFTFDDYDNCASGEPIEFLVRSPTNDDGLVVVGQHCPGKCGGWMIGISRLETDDDDDQAPDWPMHFERGKRTYTPALVIEAPDDVEVRCLTRESDG